jgi:hypothetical protein
MTTQQESGVWKRGLVLLALMGALAGVVLFTILRRPVQEVPAENLSPEPLVLIVGSPAAGLPGAFSWGALYQLGDLLPSSKGWEIRYNATLALARRGSKRVRLDVLREMLDEQKQRRNFRTTLDDGRSVPDEAAARRTVLNALKALRDWHKHPQGVRAAEEHNADQLRMVYAAVDELVNNSNPVVSAEARDTQLALHPG